MSGPPTVDQSLAARHHAAVQAARWHVSVDRLHTALEASVAHGFAGRETTADAVARYVDALHVHDLALACACADGDESAWNHFMGEYRPALVRAAGAIDRTGGGADLADGLFADLFGLRTRDDGGRQSLFRYFHGRSSLATWLRAVLAQRHIDGVRAARRLEPLPDDESRLPAAAEDADPERGRHAATMQTALTSAIATLAPRDRLRLGCYYVQHLKLAAIGRAMGEHEATVSRHLTRTRQEIRAAVEQHLRDEHRLDDRGIAECFAAVVSDSGSLDLAELVGTAPDGKNAGAVRSKE